MAIQFDRANSTQNLSTNSAVQHEQAARKADKGSVAQTGEQIRNQADSVSLSQSARALQAINQSGEQHREIDQARVAELKQAIDEGSYQVDSQRVANKMLGFDAMF